MTENSKIDTKKLIIFFIGLLSCYRSSGVITGEQTDLYEVRNIIPYGANVFSVTETGVESFAVLLDTNDIDFYNLASTSPFYVKDRTENLGFLPFTTLKWVKNTNYYLAVKIDRNIIRGQISAENRSSQQFLGISPQSSGYFINGAIEYLMLSGLNNILFVDHIAVGSGSGNVSSS